MGIKIFCMFPCFPAVAAPGTVEKWQQRSLIFRRTTAHVESQYEHGSFQNYFIITVDERRKLQMHLIEHNTVNIHI